MCGECYRLPAGMQFVCACLTWPRSSIISHAGRALIYTKQCHYITANGCCCYIAWSYQQLNATPNSSGYVRSGNAAPCLSYVQLRINIDSASRLSYRIRSHCKAFIHLQKGNPTGCKAHIYKDARPHCRNRGSTACQSSPDSFVSALLLFPMTIQGLARHVRVSLS